MATDILNHATVRASTLSDGSVVFDVVYTGGACQCCFHAYCMPGDDWCYSCAVAQELDDARVMARSARAIGDWEQTVREITLAQAVRS